MVELFLLALNIGYMLDGVGLWNNERHLEEEGGIEPHPITGPNCIPGSTLTIRDHLP